MHSIIGSLLHLCAGRTRNKMRIILAINLPIVAAILVVNMFFLYLCWRRPTRGHAPSCKLS